MAQQHTHERATVPSAALTPIRDAEQLSAVVEDLSETDAEKVLYLAENRSVTEDGPDVIIALEEWTHADWSDFDISIGPLMLAREVDDYSEDAYKLQGSFHLDFDTLGSKSVDEVEDGFINPLVQRVDATDEEFIDQKGETFLPKSGVLGIYTL